MKKLSSVLLANVFFVSSVLAGMPQFPADKIDKLEELSETEQAEAGAFMLFYDLVSQGKVGGDSGLCVSYEPGDAGGSPDKISIGLDSKSYPTGIASIDQVPAEKLNNLKSLMKQIGRYLDSGCTPGKEAECKAGRNVSITGYADAQHYGSTGKNADKIEASISKNISLAQKRASLFSEIINGEGFVNPGQVKAYGKASPIGEYLVEGLKVPEKYNPQGKNYSSANYRQNCPERRVTVIDVEFNAKKVETTSSKGTISPSVKSASKTFVKLASFGAAIQTSKAAEAVNVSHIKSDADADKVIDKIMDMNGIKNPDMRAACKNMQTRTMVKEHLSKMSSASPSVKNSLKSKSESELMRLAQLPRNTKNQEYVDNADLVAYYKAMGDGFGGIENLNKYPLLATSGQSTTLNDCFSAKSAMQAEFTRNSSLRKEMCKPVQDYMASNSDELEIKYHPKELTDGSVMHIGCQACMTGFRFVPQKVTSALTGKEETKMVPVFVDREANIADKANPELNTYRPITPDEVNAGVASAKNLKSLADTKVAELTKQIASERDPSKKKQLNKDKSFFFALGKVANGDNYLTNTPGTLGFSMNDSDKPEFQEYVKKYGINMDDFKKTVKINKAKNKPIYGTIERDYVTAKLAGNNSDAIKKYEQVILPGIKARDILSNWDGKGSNENVNNMTFGSLKKPRFYLLENCDCDCDSPNLLEQAVAKGTAYPIDEVPYDQMKQKMSKNACLVSIPVPPSCMVNPNEAGAAGKDQKPAESHIKWMGVNGENMDRAISQMKSYFASENSKVKLKGCEGLPPLAVAQKIVDSAECSGENAIPQAEEIDCKK